ncbi:MAG: hypothetical protein FGM42_02755 [Ilumatobacteraceae bacterium]|nr:hypothetical protein [Ilumatobacteraceae bacterium]
MACAVGAIGPNGGKVLGIVDNNVVEVGREGKIYNLKTASISFKVSDEWVKAYQLDGVGGWALAPSAVLEAVKDALWAEFKSSDYFYWSSSADRGLTSNGSSMAKPAGPVETMAVPFKLTPVDTAVCPSPTTTTTSSTTTSTTSTTTSTVAPSTTVGLSATKCTDDSDCQIGNTGPGGGLVVAKYEIRDADAVKVAFIEIAPDGWDGGTDPGIGSPIDVRNKLAAYKGGGRTDWRAPTSGEAQYICGGLAITPPYTTPRTCAGGLGLIEWYDGREHSRYWIHEKVTLPYAQSKNIPYWNFSKGGPDASDTTPLLRPVRVWTKQTVSLTTVATLPTTTTTTIALPPVVAWPGANAAACSDLAKCELGQRGPAGGVIIKVESGSAETVYVEMAPDGWAGTADKRDPLVDAAGATDALAKFNSGGGQWTLPIEAYIGSICHIAAGRTPKTSEACANNGRIASTFGAGGTDSFYWKGQGTTVGGKTDFVSGRNSGDVAGTAFLRPVRLVRYVPPTTTTTIPLPCMRGGVCKIGDISPTGGLIVDFSGSGSSMTYTEMAPKEWRRFVDPRSTGEPALPLTEMRSNVATLAQRTAAPWKLPTDRQMRAAFLFFANSPTFGPDCAATFSSWRTLTLEQQPYSFGSLSYWLEAAGRVNRFDNFHFPSGAAYYDVGSESKFSGRPFAERPYRGGGNPAPATWPNGSTGCATRTIPTTTTTTVLVGCSGGGRCNIGDIGPSRGLIIGIKRGPTPGDVTYTEMQIANNSTFDCQKTGLGSGCLGGGYDDFVSTRGLNGVFDDYPTVAELQLVARSATLKRILGLKNSWYFSSTYRKTAMLTGDVNADSLADLGRSLEINDSTLGVAVDMSGFNSAPRELTTAFFRGVNIWKCRFSCR